MSDRRAVGGADDGKNSLTSFAPADFLSGHYSIRLAPDDKALAIEASIIWLTEGKGEEDIGVHFFQRRNRNAIHNESLNQPQRFSTVLPASPLSYEGVILKIRWCVRVRLFLIDGREITADRYFELNKREVPESPEAVAEPAGGEEP